MSGLHLPDGCTEGCPGEHVTLTGGPLDGHLMPSDGFTAEDRAEGVAHVVDGWEWRACYSAPSSDPWAAEWPYEGAVP